jgi:hypothetical protein
MSIDNAIVEAQKIKDFLFDHPEYKSNKDVVIANIKQFPSSFGYASSELQHDEEVIKVALTDHRSLWYAPKELRSEKKFIYIKCIKV